MGKGIFKEVGKLALGAGLGFAAVNTAGSLAMTGKPFSWLPSDSVDMVGLAKASRDALGKVDVT